MSEKFIVVQGATCKCKFGKTVDKLKVLSHKKEYANDKNGSQKLIATTKEIGAATFMANTFGSCSKMNNNPCKASVTEWKGFYEDVTLSNGGKVLLEDSKATCPVGGPDCIEIVNHGQITECNAQNFKNTKPEIHNQINPLVDVNEVLAPQATHEGCEDSSK